MARELVDNLKICPSGDRKTFELSVKVNTDEMRIDSVHLHRERKHHVSDFPNVYLHLVEVQDLNVCPAAGLRGAYKASMVSPKSILSNGSKPWWEVSLSSRSATSALEETEARELGDMVPWSPRDIIANGAVKDLCRVVWDLVRRLDNVGCMNIGARGGSGTRSSDKEPKTDEEKYW